MGISGVNLKCNQVEVVANAGKRPQWDGLSYLSLRFKIGEPSCGPTSI